jgi:hypothetical protein
MTTADVHADDQDIIASGHTEATTLRCRCEFSSYWPDLRRSRARHYGGQVRIALTIGIPTPLATLTLLLEGYSTLISVGLYSRVTRRLAESTSVT